MSKIGTPFQKGNKGKPKGAVNKTTKAVKEVFAEAFTELQRGEETKLAVWGKDNLTEFYKLAAKLIPLQVAGDPDSPLKSILTVNVIHSPTPIAQTEEEVS